MYSKEEPPPQARFWPQTARKMDRRRRFWPWTDPKTHL